MNNNQVVKCEFCGREGILGKDIVMEDYVNPFGHDSSRPACRNIEACEARRDARYEAWREAQDLKKEHELAGKA
jgi:hypothetical protein